MYCIVGQFAAWFPNPPRGFHLMIFHSVTWEKLFIDQNLVCMISALKDTFNRMLQSLNVLFFSNPMDGPPN